MNEVGLPILTYHAIDTSKSPIATDPTWFAESMALWHEHGYRTVDLAEWIRAGRPAREHEFAITFDDGLASVVNAPDVLSRYGFEATVFVVTERVGGDNAWPSQRSGIPVSPLLDWPDLAALTAHRFAVGSHTRRHAVLNTLRNEELRSELWESRFEIEDRLGEPCPLLAFPYGIASLRVRTVASRSYMGAFGTRPRRACADEDPHQVSRLDAYDLRDEARLKRLLRGQLPHDLPIRHVVREARKSALVWNSARRRAG
jgi:peptidoglycan/xylan/chitin deacetylase (PgdA/CDA1 family)